MVIVREEADVEVVYGVEVVAVLNQATLDVQITSQCTCGSSSGIRLRLVHSLWHDKCHEASLEFHDALSYTTHTMLAATI